ncbi:MAG: 50S ribosomal protein L6 [bacterium]|nr:50S ribosomal protein L6 [bacterium]
MTTIGKQPVIIPEGVSVKNEAGRLLFHGPKGDLTVKIIPHVSVLIEGSQIKFSPTANSKQAFSNWGTLRSIAASAVTGVNSSFVKELEIEGVGFRAVMEGKNLTLHLGYSHPVKVEAPEGIIFSVEKNTMTVSGIDKYLVGQTAAKIRALKKPEPYKGKGIRYKGEIIRRKSGKKVAGTAA